MVVRVGVKALTVVVVVVVVISRCCRGVSPLRGAGLLILPPETVSHAE